MGTKTIPEAYILALGLGIFGLHHLYLKRKKWCILYICTGGLCGVGYIVDLIRLPFLVKHANESPDDKRMDDAYLLWAVFGLLGFHHFYLGNKQIGILYATTLGLFGIGWIIDGYFLRFYVKETNDSGDCLKQESGNYSRLGLSIALSISPLGIFGAHHFFLGRKTFGLIYCCSFGLFGVGYIIDWLRTPFVLVTRKDNKKIYIDDVYLLCVFLGFLGIHHLYLRRKKWFILYIVSFGVFGIGWIIDMIQIPSLVQKYNDKLEVENTSDEVI